MIIYDGVLILWLCCTARLCPADLGAELLACCRLQLQEPNINAGSYERFTQAWHGCVPWQGPLRGCGFAHQHKPPEDSLQAAPASYALCECVSPLISTQPASSPHHGAPPPFAGEAFYYFLQMVWAIYKQLAAMKVLPQITVGKATVSVALVVTRWLQCIASAYLVLATP